MNRKKMTLFNYVNGVFLLLLVIVCILPILHVIALSLSERIEAVAGNVTFYPSALRWKLTAMLWRTASSGPPCA